MAENDVLQYNGVRRPPSLFVNVLSFGGTIFAIVLIFFGIQYFNQSLIIRHWNNDTMMVVVTWVFNVCNFHTRTLQNFAKIGNSLPSFGQKRCFRISVVAHESKNVNSGQCFLSVLNWLIHCTDYCIDFHRDSYRHNDFCISAVHYLTFVMTS